MTKKIIFFDDHLTKATKQLLDDANEVLQVSGFQVIEVASVKQLKRELESANASEISGLIIDVMVPCVGRDMVNLGYFHPALENFGINSYTVGKQIVETMLTTTRDALLQKYPPLAQFKNHPILIFSTLETDLSTWDCQTQRPPAKNIFSIWKHDKKMTEQLQEWLNRLTTP